MIQMHAVRGRIVANNRADEMVLAGSAPRPSEVLTPLTTFTGDEFHRSGRRRHRRLSAATALAAMGYLGTAAGNVFLGTGVFTGLMIYRGYRNRKPWAYWPSVVILFSPV